TFVIAGLASMGMPAFSGFPAELTILIGVWQFSKVWAILAALGILIAAAFTLRAIQVAFFGQAGAQAPAATADHAHPFSPITWPENTGTALLLATPLLIGLKPDLLLNWIVPSLQSPLLRAIWHGGAQ
ncbi:MAG: NADH-quinone oxidoreductase subunit M, partial [Verrucomicrobiales bacterium VVV1]